MKIEEIKKILTGKQKIDNSLGSELKRRRLIKNQTLAQVSDNICSISYTSKVENSILYPKVDVLRQICSNLDITPDQMKSLINLENILIRSIEAYYYNDSNNLEDIYQRIKKLDNFRSDIVKVIYYLNKEKYSLIEKINDTIDQMLDSLNNLDVLVYAVFCGVLYNRHQEYYQSNQIIKTVLPHLKNHKILEVIAYNNMCDNYYNLNNSFFLKHYEETIRKNNIFNNKKQITRLKELSFMYYFKNDKNEMLKESLFALRGEKNYKNFEVLYEYKLENEKFFNSLAYSDLDYFIACKVSYKFDKLMFKSLIQQLDNKKMNITKQIHLRYLSIDDMEEKIMYLSQTCYLHSIRIKDEYLANIYGSELIDYYVDKAKYKKALRISEEIRKLTKESSIE